MLFIFGDKGEATCLIRECLPVTEREGKGEGNIPQGGGQTRAKSGEVEGGGRRAEGGHWADHEGLWRTADGEKFLLRFSTAVILMCHCLINGLDFTSPKTLKCFYKSVGPFSLLSRLALE